MSFDIGVLTAENAYSHVDVLGISRWYNWSAPWVPMQLILGFVKVDHMSWPPLSIGKDMHLLSPKRVYIFAWSRWETESNVGDKFGTRQALFSLRWVWWPDGSYTVISAVPWPVTHDLAPPKPLIFWLVEVYNDDKSLHLEWMWVEVLELIMAVGKLEILLVP